MINLHLLSIEDKIARMTIGNRQSSFWAGVWSLLFVIQLLHNKAVVHSYECTLPESKSKENRVLLIATCDTRSGYKEFNALKVWKVTGRVLHDAGVSMVNVCKGKNWGMHGFLTKPLLYVNYLRSFLTHEKAQDMHAILMDSDTFWSAENVEHIWKNYDCARNGKDLVVSTEMSCWVGRYCGQEDIDRWYKDTSIMPSYSPFVNSGVVMGKISEIVKMLDYVIVNNQSYYTTYGKKYKFDDQYAIADYAIKVAPQVSALDYHQLISASCSIHAPGNPPDEGWPFLCKNRNGTLSFSCHIWNGPVKKQGHFAINPETCIAHRKTFPGMILEEELSSLGSKPLVWHGNGMISVLVVFTIIILFIKWHIAGMKRIVRGGQMAVCGFRLPIFQMLVEENSGDRGNIVEVMGNLTSLDLMV